MKFIRPADTVGLIVTQDCTFEFLKVRATRRKNNVVVHEQRAAYNGERCQNQVTSQYKRKVLHLYGKYLGSAIWAGCYFREPQNTFNNKESCWKTQEKIAAKCEMMKIRGTERLKSCPLSMWAKICELYESGCPQSYAILLALRITSIPSEKNYDMFL